MQWDEFQESIKLLREIAGLGLNSPSPAEWRRNLESIAEVSSDLIRKMEESHVAETMIPAETDLPSPDIRVGSFVLNRGKEILLIRRQSDGLWTLPSIAPSGMDSAREAALRAIREDTGLEAISHRCLAIFNARSHPYPDLTGNRYTLIYECRITGGKLCTGATVLDAAFFPLNQLPELSPVYVLSSQLYMLYSLSAQKNLLTYSD